VKNLKLTGLFLAGALALAAAQPVPVIFDTDMGNDIDDALALAMLHGLQSRGEIQLVAVTVTKANPWAARYVSAVNTFYGRGATPIGVVGQGGVTPDEGQYARKAIEAGRWKYTEATQDAVSVLRAALASQPDGSVIIIQVGFSTNLARLVSTDEGVALVKRKVKRLVLMAGDFANSRPEYNVKEDVAAAQKLVARWPTPRVWSGFEIGLRIKYPARSIERDFAWSSRHPVVDGYKAFDKFPYDRETWDLTAALEALRPEADYFGMSAPGRVTVEPDGLTKFKAEAGGQDRYLTVTAEQAGRAREAMIWLASQPAR
jgi:inosine-uridine nucleoside N-ribohydrolase